MKIIPLRAVPNQRFTFSNGQDRWVIEIKVAITSMICNLWLNDEPVLLGSRIVAGVPIIWSPRLATVGNFGILTEAGEEPWWEQFGTSQRLVFWESDMAIASSRFVDFRSRHISPSLAELTALVNTAMKIEDIGYFPPTWQALQEAISYALSVVRSHAPEQGQILLATQMLTSAMGDLIEWLGINFAVGEWGDELEFSRASTATYWGPEGSLLESAVDEARIQHDPVTGECKGMLVEEQRTNLLDYSENFTAGTWDPRNLTVSPNAAVAPDGVKSATVITPDGGALSSRLVIRNLQEHRIVSFYVKSAGVRYVALSYSNRNFSAAFDLITGEMIAGISILSSSIDKLSDGWWRITAGFRDGSINSLVPLDALKLADGSTASTFSGSDGLYVWGAQIEEGTKPTSYIPTIGSPVTRAADNAVIDLSDVFNPDEGTLRITAQVPEGEVVASLGGMQVVSDSSEFKAYRMTYSDYTGVPTVTLGNGIHSNLEYFPKALS